MTDAGGDLVDPDDRPADGPAYVDIVALQVSASGGDLTLLLGLGAEVPAEMSALVEVLNYVVVLETTGDGDFDFWIAYENRESGAWSAGLSDWRDGQSHNDERFPGALTHTGDSILGRISLAALGDPTGILACAVTQRSGPDFNVTAEDNAPDGTCLGGDGWQPLR